MRILSSSTPLRAARNNNPIPDDNDLTAEQRFIAAILRQALADLRSQRPLIRAEAQRFWGSPSVAFWDELLDLGGKLRRYSQALLLGGLLLFTGCVPGGSVDRELGKLLGQRTPEEHMFCQTVQQQYLAKPVPELPPSCSDILKAQRERQAVQP